MFSILGASVAYNVNPVADQFQRAFQTSTFCNRLYSFFNKRWFFDQVSNDFLVRSFLRFGYEVAFEALDKGAIEILGPYGISYTFRRLAKLISQLQSGFVVRRVRYDPWPPAWKGCTAVVRALRLELFVVLAGMQVNESHPLASEVLTPLSLKGRYSNIKKTFTAPFCNFPSFVRPRGCKKRDRGGYLAGVVSVVCHEVPMDKGTSESSLLGAGSPLPSIPLHSIISEDIRGSNEWGFPYRVPDEGRPSHPVRRAGISRPFYHYAFAILLGSTLFVTFSCMWDSLSSWVDNRPSFILISRIIIELKELARMAW
ncbi:hypothetical protein ES332_D04G102000v1 [Gossypium tomentosum]|uniref:NADH dehydrogenase subunit 5 C-terminal domain-containing protein n=1 Tax=Gossypium tomentosum TaxID=34277 RepID=A0A5D2LCB7_GOSTO|nr:hypothetical protein ES332_D04G102000v1 [Gossypium tomentosum]